MTNQLVNFNSINFNDYVKGIMDRYLKQSMHVPRDKRRIVMLDGENLKNRNFSNIPFGDCETPKKHKYTNIINFLIKNQLVDENSAIVIVCKDNSRCPDDLYTCRECIDVIYLDIVDVYKMTLSAPVPTQDKTATDVTAHETLAAHEMYELLNKGITSKKAEIAHYLLGHDDFVGLTILFKLAILNEEQGQPIANITMYSRDRFKDVANIMKERRYVTPNGDHYVGAFDHITMYSAWERADILLNNDDSAKNLVRLFEELDKPRCRLRTLLKFSELPSFGRGSKLLYSYTLPLDMIKPAKYAKSAKKTILTKKQRNIAGGYAQYMENKMNYMNLKS
jgi:hypothetical protein